jgi:hypothetical protein
MLMAGMVDLPVGPVNIKLSRMPIFMDWGDALSTIPLRSVAKRALDITVNVV